MIRLVLCFLLVTLSSVAHASLTTEPDKQLHFGVCFTLSAATYVALRDNHEPKPKAALYAIGFATLVGIGKELSDAGEPNNHFDNRDLVADVAGAVFAPVLLWSF